MTEPLLVERRGAVKVLTLNRPGSFNALNDVLIADIHRELDRIESDPTVRAVVITGAGRAFSSGADLSGPGDDGGGRDYAGVLALPEPQRSVELKRIGVATRDGLLDHYNPLMVRLHAFNKPFVAAVNGTAAGGGVGLALTCDIVLAAESARFVQVFAPKLGLVPDCGITWHLPRTVGMARAHALAMLGDALSAAEAERLGLIWRMVPDAELLAQAIGIAERLAANPAHVNGLVKKVFREAMFNDFSTQITLEAMVQGDCGEQPSFVEGVLAFQEKRAPVFHPQEPER